MKFYLSIVMLLLGSITMNLNAQIPGTQNFVFYSLNTPPPAPLFFAIHGANANDRSGWSVSGAGDVNGDGIDDVIIGAPRADPNGGSSGVSYVVFGKATTTPIELSNIEANTGNHGFEINGADPDDRSGYTVSAAGDVNGDGINDIIVGAPRSDPNGNVDSGTSYVVFGRNSDTTVELSDIENNIDNHGFAIHGVAANDRSGWSVSGIGDVNGDDRADVIVGAYQADRSGGNSGSSYVVFGKATTTPIELSNIDNNTGNHGFAIHGVDVSDFSGWSVSGAGDVNNDGIDDIIVGAYGADPNGVNSGSSYVVFGKTTTTPIELSNIETNIGNHGFAIHGDKTSDRSGYAVSAAGDVNNDGYDDIIVGAYRADENGGKSGSSYVVFGKTTTTAIALSNIKSNTGNHGFVIHGADAYDRSGHAVSAAGDVNNDGYDDIVLGAYTADPNGNTSSGTSYVVFGMNTTTPIELSDIETNTGNHGFAIHGVGGGDYGGFSVSGVGDINNDGFDDVIVGAYQANPNGGDSGSSYIVFGKATYTPVQLSD